MSQPVALITGISGQDGSYLAELLVEKGYAVHGIARSTSSLENIHGLCANVDVFGRSLIVHQADVGDGEAMCRLVRQISPHEIYHLAGQSHIGLSLKAPELTFEQTGKAAVRLLEIVRQEKPEAKFFQASSAEIFGNTEDVPQIETTAFQPTNPYGEAKAFATREAQRYRDAYGLFVCNGILYNHESPRRGENFVTQKIAGGVARIALGLERKLVLGNLESRRDWGRAEDYVRAMWLILQDPSPEDYIIATGVTHSVKDFVQAAFAVVNLPWRQFTEQDPGLIRPSDPQLVGSPAKIRQKLGWSSTGTFEDLVREMVEAQLRRLAAR